MLRIPFLLLTAAILPLFTKSAHADTIDIESSAAWRTTATAPPAGWNTQVGFDDSDAAGWQNAFKSPTGNHIWIISNMSGQSPNQAWFRFVFNIPSALTAASGSFFFDDDGEAYINGQQVVNDASGGSNTIDLPAMNPSLFVVGSNLVAVHGIDKIAPFSNIGVSLNLTLVPEPIAMPLVLAGGLLARRWR